MATRFDLRLGGEDPDVGLTEFECNAIVDEIAPGLERLVKTNQARWVDGCDGKPDQLWHQEWDAEKDPAFQAYKEFSFEMSYLWFAGQRDLAHRVIDRLRKRTDWSQRAKATLGWNKILQDVGGPLTEGHRWMVLAVAKKLDG